MTTTLTTTEKDLRTSQAMKANAVAVMGAAVLEIEATVVKKEPTRSKIPPSSPATSKKVLVVTEDATVTVVPEDVMTVRRRKPTTRRPKASLTSRAARVRVAVATRDVMTIAVEEDVVAVTMASDLTDMPDLMDIPGLMVPIMEVPVTAEGAAEEALGVDAVDPSVAASSTLWPLYPDSSMHPPRPTIPQRTTPLPPTRPKSKTLPPKPTSSTPHPLSSSTSLFPAPKRKMWA
jgi:hypothetical protein